MGTAGLRDFVVVAPASVNHHHYHHHTQDPILENHQINGSNSSTALGIGVIPLLGAAPCLASQNVKDPDNMLNNKFTGIQFWQNQNSAHNLKRPSSIPHNNNSSTVNLIESGGQNDGDSGSGSGSSTGAMCQDCGNQAKKDCSYRRCRTCCKSRSFECPTHVKSTWMPATRRREHQVKAAGATTAGLSGSTVGPKKPRALITSQTAPTTSHTSTSNATPRRSFDTSSATQNAGFRETLPTQIRETALFKCVRVTAVEEGEDEFAYETVVKIGGHVFKGLLYDQGVDGSDGFPNISQLQLGGGGGRNGGSSSSPVHHPSEFYEAANGCGLLGGSNYGNPIN